MINKDWIAFYFLILGCFCLQLGFGQQPDLQSGFKALEDGEWDKARSFFSDVLSQDPSNRTARLCYARAVGLGGSPDSALNLFEDLLKDYPGDYEIRLNRAEAMLWNQNFEGALPYYQKLITEDSSSFTATLGYANTLSSLKQYQDALQTVNKALHLDPSNANALISKKYILLGLADYYRRNWKFSRSEMLLDSLLQIFPKDREALLSKSGLYLSENKPGKAKEVFRKLAGGIDPLEGNLGLSYVSILKQKPKSALQYAEDAKVWVNPNDTISASRLLTLQIQAHSMSGHYTTARSLLEKAAEFQPDASQLISGRLYSWLQDYDEAESAFLGILKEEKTAFDTYMSLAELYRATHRYDEAINNLEQALLIEPNQPDAVRSLQNIRLNDRPSLELESGYLEDSGNNSIINTDIAVHFGRKGNWKPFARIRYHRSSQEQTDLAASYTNLNIGTEYRFGPFSKVHAEVGAQPKFQAGDQDGIQITGAIRGLHQFGRHWSLELILQRIFHNYTVSLVENSLSMLDKGLNLNFSHPRGPGLFAQLMHTNQADKNNRNLLFASAFYRIVRLPVVKFGINVLAFSYTDQVDNYFSPSEYKLGEVFANISTIDHLRSKWRMDLLLAFGRQEIEEISRQNTRRLELTIANQLNDHIKASLSFRHSNAALFNTLGFRSNRYSLHLQYQLPVRKQIIPWEAKK